MPGYVAEYECREAARFSNYTWLEFESLDRYERATIIAYYRMHGLVERHVQQAIDGKHRVK